MIQPMAGFRLLLIISLLFTGKIVGQNLFPNPGFELYNQCPTYTSQISYCTDWDSACGTADFYHCGYYEPSSLGSYGIPETGSGVIGFLCAPPNIYAPGLRFYGEDIKASLISPLEPGAKYKVDAHLLFNQVNMPPPSATCFDIGFYFYKSGNLPLIKRNECPPFNPHIRFDASTVLTNAYSSFSGEWIADSCYDHVLIGFFCSDNTYSTFCEQNSSTFYFDIDNVSLTKIAEAPSFSRTLLTDKNSFCESTCTSFQLIANRNPFQYEWSFPGATPPYSTNKNPSGICYNKEGKFNVQLITHYECFTDTLLQTDFVQVKGMPFLSLEADSFPQCFGTPVEVKAISNATVTWSDGLVADSRTVSKNGIYIATAENECGIKTDTLNAEFEDCPCTVFIPNTFTPNGDNKNDQLKVEVSCNLSSFKFSIWNRWGQQVFSSVNPQSTWDGFYNGKLCEEGIYTMLLVYKGYMTERLKTISKKGTVLLLR